MVCRLLTCSWDGLFHITACFQCCFILLLLTFMVILCIVRVLNKISKIWDEILFPFGSTSMNMMAQCHKCVAHFPLFIDSCSHFLLPSQIILPVTVHTEFMKSSVEELHSHMVYHPSYINTHCLCWNVVINQRWAMLTRGGHLHPHNKVRLNTWIRFNEVHFHCVSIFEHL